MILTVENDIVIPSLNCYVIPELDCLIKTKKKNGVDYIPFLTYLFLMTDPNSPYNNLTETDKEETVKRDIEEKFNISIFLATEPELIIALEKLIKLETTPIKRFYESVVKAVDKINSFVDTNEPTEETIDKWLNIVKSADVAMKKLRDVNKEYQDEVKSRGNLELAYDQ